MSLTVTGARLAIGSATILSDAGFTIEAGKLNALIGPNGAGKSTLLRIILGLEPRANGTVTFKGRDFHTLARRDRARIAALVEQSATTDLQIAVHDVVMMGRIPHQDGWGGGSDDKDERMVADALDRVGMRTFESRAFATLSGGEQQRVHIARALAQQPDLLLLDEPTNHLDISAQLAVLALLRSMADEGMTVLVTMHDLNLAGGFFDHLIALDAGRVVAHGAPDAVLTPQFLGQTYGVAASVVPNPRTGRPMLALGGTP